MKNIVFIFIIFFSLLTNDLFSQCAFNNTLISTLTPTCPGTTTIPCIVGGQYVAVNVVSGNNYVFSTCGGATWDTQITLYNAAGTTSLGYSDDACGLQSSVSWTATYTGIANILIDQYFCTNNATCATLTITCTVPVVCTPTTNTTCATADPFCTSLSYNYCNNTGIASLGGGGIYGCLGSSPNPAFFYLNISSSGSISITINQYSTAGAPIDVDFICWGPFASQAAMCPGLSTTNIVDCSYSAAATEVCDITGAVTGQWYMIMITNYSNTVGYVQFSQTSGTGTTNCGILPVELLSLIVEKKDGHNLLKWVTASEINNNYFTVEKSSNGTSWQILGTKSGAGNSNFELNYEMRDENPINGLNYYKLSQTDFNGATESFNIIVIDNTQKPKTVLKTVNFMGQDVKEDYEGLKIIYFSDGSIVKKIGL